MDAKAPDSHAKYKAGEYNKNKEHTQPGDKNATKEKMAKTPASQPWQLEA